MPAPIARYTYNHGRSSIVYIGTTKRGAGRIAGSAVNVAQKILIHRGMKSLSLYVVTCAPRRKIKTWAVLERALLGTFRSEYGELPMANTAGKKKSYKTERSQFNERLLRTIIEGFEDSPD